MEHLPPINEMYTSMLEHRDYDVIRKYQNTRVGTEPKRTPTQKHTFLDQAVKMNCSPGPANPANHQQAWALPKKLVLKHSPRRTYIDEIQLGAKRRNSPSPNQYSLKCKWPDQKRKPLHSSPKTNFLDNHEYEADKIPGPGAYRIATRMGEKVRKGTHSLNKPLQPHKDISASMTSYDPIPRDYHTFSGYAKFGKAANKLRTGRVETNGPAKQQKENVPGPGQYQLIHTWAEKQRKPGNGQSSYLTKISKAHTMGVYHN